MAEVAEGAYEVNPRGQVWTDYGGRSVPVEGSGIRERESTSSGFAWFRTFSGKAAPESTPPPRTATPAPSVELTELTAAPKAALAAASAPALEGDGEENYARDLGQPPGTSRGRKLKISAVASLFLVAVALGARAGLAPKSAPDNNKANREAKAVTLEGCLAMEAEGSPGAGRSRKINSPEPIRRDLRHGSEAGRPAEAPSRRRVLDCEELLAANREESSGAGKSSKTGKSTKTTKLSSTTTSKTSKSSTSSDASRGSEDSPASISLSANEGETSVSYGVPPVSKPTTSDQPTSYVPTSYAPTSYVPTSYAPTSYAPTSYAPTNEIDPDAPCSGRGTLDPSGRQCTCNRNYFGTVINGVPDCLKVVPVGLGCGGQQVPSCKEMKFSPEPKCCPRPPRGDLLICIPTTGSNAGVCV